MKSELMVGEILSIEYFPSLGLDEHEMVHVKNFRACSCLWAQFTLKALLSCEHWVLI